MDSLGLLIALLVLLVIGLPILVIVQFFSNRGKIQSLQQQVDTLRSTLAGLEQRISSFNTASTSSERNLETTNTSSANSSSQPEDESGSADPDDEVDEADRLESPSSSVADTDAATVSAAARMPPAHPERGSESPAQDKNSGDPFENFFRRIAGFLLSYFTDGNVFVRIGILVLFCGVAFLLKYAAENSNIPIEFRFIGAAIGGLILLTFGWRLRLRQPIYGLLLQGGGSGVIYITIFAAFRIAELIPPTLTLVLLVSFAAITVALSILQDSRALAIYAVLGGFLAPFLASTGSGNWVGLFSYYAIVNAAVFAVAWFRAWRALNLIGFLFTFGVFILWVAFDYQTDDLLPASGFLILFFFMYSLIGVLYALRQPKQLTGLVDGSIVFGTPVVVSGLLMAMMRHLDYGIAAATAAMGLYYVVLARYAWRHVGEEFRLLAEAMLAIGVVFATLAIPYALDGHWSSAAWALEAAGILWVSIRQQRFYAQCFAIALQIGAGLIFMFRNIDDVGQLAWLNPAFLGGIFIALGAFISARMLYLQTSDFKLRGLHLGFYVWAMAWWLISVLVQIDEFYRPHQISAWLILFTATSVVLVVFDRLRQWHWMPASVNAALLLPTLILIAIHSLDENNAHVLVSPDWLFWVAALAANYWIIEKLETVAWPNSFQVAAHTTLIVFVSMLLAFELVWLFTYRLAIPGEAYYAVFAAMPLLAMYLTQISAWPALKRVGVGLQYSLIGVLSALMLLWHLILNLSNSGNPEPLPYLPLLNPVDLSHLVFFVLALRGRQLLPESMQTQKNHLGILLAGLCFLWLTALLMRSMHHLLDIHFSLSTMMLDTRVQTAISILWTVIGMAGMWFASRREIRPLWVMGAALVGVVLVKMFFIDLDASGTVERIVSFLVVGSLLVATGYYSPIPENSPDNHSESDPVPESTSHV